MSRGHRRADPSAIPVTGGPITAVRVAAPLAIPLAAALLALAGCSSVGPTDNPAARKLSWFSYLNGDDLRSRCGKDGADRFRLVFNADYNRHVRTYDVVSDPGKGGAAIEAHVIEATDLARLTPADPFSAARGRTATIQLTPAQFDSLVGRLGEDGAFEPPPRDMRLPSNGFYWLISGCRAGQWFFTAYPYPSRRFTEAGFPEALRRIDPTGVAFPTLPPPGDAPRTRPSAGDRAEDGLFFEVEVDRDGLVGPTAPFGALLSGLARW
ncbi:hypothetical protein [Azospirillum picis]|uniref:Lipoprotein n=1 Tax=Azospirillum picis TaxID=488438 RepID=A0ABU0MF58_9PROT|nr:hypothetical protein [Azospirillum picis]MBP2298238.1 hypothetical protein [Azospirillum picis]MDQ0532076.1 hypothetical protein [Azospirillum picis]